MRLIGLVLLAATLALAPRAAAEAQESKAGKVYRVGHLSSLDKPTVNHAAFREKLRELGWIEGVNIVFEDRFAGRDGKRLAAFAAELAHLPADLIFTTGGVESGDQGEPSGDLGMGGCSQSLGAS